MALQRYYEFKKCEHLRVNGAPVCIKSGVWPVYESPVVNFVTVVVDNSHKISINGLDFKALKLQRKAQLKEH